MVAAGTAWALAGGLALLLAGGGLVAWQQGLLASGAPEVVGMEHAWGEVGPDHAVLRTNLTLRNPQGIAVPVPAVRYEVVANGVPLGRGTSAPTTLPPGGEGVVPLATRVPHDAAVEAFLRHLAQGERSTVEVRGTALLEGRALPLEFQRSEAFTTALVERLAGRGTCDGGLLPCVANSTHAWTQRNDTPALDSRLVLRNPLPFAVPLGALTVELRLQGVAVAHGASAGEVTLPAQAQQEVGITTLLDPAGLRAWWPRHVQACEASPARLDLGLDLGGFAQGQAQGLDLGVLRTGLACGERS
jgi:LEA14-like dessication related protein